MIQATIEQLRTSTLIAQVGGSADIDPDINVQSLPAAFVVLGGERASDNTHTGAIQQLVTSQFVVMYAVRNVRDADGVESAVELEPLRKEVHGLLIGWAPESKYDPLIFRSGQLLQMDDAGVLWWVDTFETQFIKRHV